MTSFPNERCHLKISSQKHFQWRVCHCFYLKKLLFVSLLDWILYSFSHYREYILPGTLSFPPPPTVEILPLPLLNQHPPAGEREWGCETLHVSMVRKGNPHLATIILFWLHVVFFSELVGTLQPGKQSSFSLPRVRSHSTMSISYSHLPA